MSKEKRREDLLIAARRVFATKGYHDAKVGDIAAVAKVAKGTVYLYFPDKRSIFVELIDNLFLRLSAAILRVDTAGNVAAQIKHNIRAILSVLIDDPDTMRMLFAHGAGVDPAFSAKIESLYDGLKKLLADSLVDGQELGIVAPGDVALYAAFTIGALKELLVESVTKPAGRSREQIVGALYKLLQQGYLRVAPDPARAHESTKGR